MKKLSPTQSFLLPETATVKAADACIRGNAPAIVFVTEADGRVIGSVTDGDICRFADAGGRLDENIRKCMCSTPVTVQNDSSRRDVLRLFDQKILAIPEVDKAGRLQSVITSDNYGFPRHRRVMARAKAPVRISFAGGGTDLTHYFKENTGSVLSTTIQLYGHATLTKRPDRRIVLYSGDFDIREDFESIDQILAAALSGRLGLLKAIIKLLRPAFGFELITYSDVPPGSGLGGSAAIAAAVIGCFNEFREDALSAYEIAELAFQAERIELGVQGGWQDQYASVFGGFNYIEFTDHETLVHPLRINPATWNELESNLLICFTGRSRDSGRIHADQKKTFETDRSMSAVMDQTKDITQGIKKALLHGDLDVFANLLETGWLLKCRYAPSICDSGLADIYQKAKDGGAVSGKLMGAGGGGFFLFYVTPFNRVRLRQVLAENGLRTETVAFDKAGLRSWVVRCHTAPEIHVKN
ncbi:MAG: sugar kinase [Pseudomonadota bacterium]